MIRITPRDRAIRHALQRVPALAESTLAAAWPDTDAGRVNMERRLWQLCEAGLIARHVAVAKVAPAVALFYHWAPRMADPDFGPLAWALAQRWAALEPQRVVFYSTTPRSERHYGRAVKNPLKTVSALAHDLLLGAVYWRFAILDPLLASAWAAEDQIAATRGYGEKVVDACIVDSTSTPALAIEVAGSSYAASNGERLKAIHSDCRSRSLPYEMWTVARGGSP